MQVLRAPISDPVGGASDSHITSSASGSACAVAMGAMAGRALAADAAEGVVAGAAVVAAVFVVSAVCADAELTSIKAAAAAKVTEQR